MGNRSQAVVLCMGPGCPVQQLTDQPAVGSLISRFTSVAGPWGALPSDLKLEFYFFYFSRFWMSKFPWPSS